MAHTKTSKATKGSRKSQPKHLGIKRYEGESVHAGEILLRQRGAEVKSGEGTRIGRDYTVYAVISGKVKYHERRNQSFVSVIIPS